MSRKFIPKRCVLSVIVAVLSCLLILLCLLLFSLPETASQIGIDETEISKNENSISIPGYEVLTLKADTTKQNISLANPRQNTCVFIISLYLEDGTLMWQSNEIKPGKESRPIILSQPLDAGYYPNARLVYQCFTDDREHRQLNGAEMKLALRVQ